MGHRTRVVTDGVLPVDVEVDALIPVEVLAGLADVFYGGGAVDPEHPLVSERAVAPASKTQEATTWEQ